MVGVDRRNGCPPNVKILSRNFFAELSRVRSFDGLWSLGRCLSRLFFCQDPPRVSRSRRGAKNNIASLRKEFEGLGNCLHWLVKRKFLTISFRAWPGDSMPPTRGASHFRAEKDERFPEGTAVGQCLVSYELHDLLWGSGNSAGRSVR